MEEGLVGAEGEGQGTFLVKRWVGGEVVDDIGQEMGPLDTAARRLVAQRCEMHVQVIVGGLVMQVHAQTGRGDAETLRYGLLKREENKHQRENQAGRARGSAGTDRPCSGRKISASSVSFISLPRLSLRQLRAILLPGSVIKAKNGGGEVQRAGSGGDSMRYDPLTNLVN